MSYVRFEQYGEGKNAEYNIINNKDEILGTLERVRVGAWISWCLVNVSEYKIYFSASCLDEIRAKIKSLNAETSRKSKTH